MKTLRYKLILILLFVLNNLAAQNKQNFVKTIKVDSQSTAIINLDNCSILIEPSLDGKFHIDFDLSFKNYSKKEINELLEKVKIEADMFENHITIIGSNIEKTHSYYNIPDEIVLSSNLFKSEKESKKDIERKSKDHINSEIVGDKEASHLLENLKKQFDDTKKFNKWISTQEKKTMSNFVIKIPPFIKFIINAKDSQINLKGTFNNEISLDLKRGSFKATNLNNNNNKFNIETASFMVSHIDGGTFSLNNISKGLIGSVSNAIVTSEFSKIEIGEIQQNVSITDFSSKLWFYNFTDNFSRFDLFSEYSEVHLFSPKKDYSLTVFGNNTVSHLNGAIIKMQPTKNGEKFRMLDRKSSKEGVFSGAINFEIVHGIIYL